MRYIVPSPSMQVHRRIGGLENHPRRGGDCEVVHRRIGGLENISRGKLSLTKVHRRIGGLESVSPPCVIEICGSPPHRRLRKL